MEAAAVAEQPVEEQVEAAPEDEKKATPTANALAPFRFSSWLHVGPGAEECGDVDEGTNQVNCSNPLHFHVWCRLPNQFEARDLATKALAAKARKTRQLKSEGSDAFEIMEEELGALQAMGEEGKKALIEELVSRDWWKDYFEAEAEVLELPSDDPDADEGATKFEHIKDDEHRYDELKSMSDEERPGDEYEELERHIGSFHEGVREVHKRIGEAKKEALAQRGLDDLVAEVRRERIAAIAAEEFHYVKSVWSYVYGVRTKKQGPQVWSDPQQLREVAPEINDAVKALFDDLEQTEEQGGRAAGNS